MARVVTSGRAAAIWSHWTSLCVGIDESSARIVRLEQALSGPLPRTLMPLVQALQALRAAQLIAANTVVAELQDFMRFEHPRQLMALPT